MSDVLWNVEVYDATTRDSDTATPPPTSDPRLLRDTLGKFATGVTALTYESNGAFHGTTVNSFTSVSLDPPLVLVSLKRTSRALTYLMERPFAVNVLAEDQLDAALQFAGGEPAARAVEWVTDETAPRINGALAYFQCTPWAGYDGGDHVLLLGRVLTHGEQEGMAPLLFYRGKWGALAPETGDAS